MPRDAKKLLSNHALGLSGQIASVRLKRSGIILDKDSGLPKIKAKNYDLLKQTATKKSAFPPALVKRLAGG